jgi:hypothetical protein
MFCRSVESRRAAKTSKNATQTSPVDSSDGQRLLMEGSICSVQVSYVSQLGDQKPVSAVGMPL